MKKILLVLMLFLFAQNAFSYEYFDYGRTAYEDGRYGQAKEFLELAVRNRPKNTVYRYYYALTLAQLGMIEEAAEQYQTIALSSPNSDEGQKSTRALDSMKSYFETKAGEFTMPDEDNSNYMKYLIIENKDIKRWNKQTLNVYIQESESKTIVEKAFQNWGEKSGNILKFNFVPTTALADITVKFVEKLPPINNEYGMIDGLTNVKYIENNINHADISIQDRDPKTRDVFSPEKIYATALHEIGHAIGLNAHSENEKDIMYSRLGEENKSISQADINTLKMLYGISAESMADIHQHPYAYSIKLTRAKDYVAAYPNIPTAWSGLAAAYVAINDYENAISSIQKAIDLKGDDATFYTQLAGYYTKLNKSDLAIQAYKKAYDIQPDNKVYLLNWAKACYKSKRAEEARADVDSYLMGDGFMANDEISRVLRRMYKQDKEKEKAKIKKDREDKKRKLEEIQEMEQEMFVD